MSEFKKYKRKSISEMMAYIPGKPLSSKVSISEADLEAGSPKEGDMIARNPKNHEDMWLVAKDYFLDNLEEVEETIKVDTRCGTAKTLTNTTAKGASKQVKDIEFWGDGDTFKLISKASSQSEGWMKSTKAMSIPGLGCVVQVTTQQGDNIAEAVTFVPGARIEEEVDKSGKAMLRKLVTAGE